MFKGIFSEIFSIKSKFAFNQPSTFGSKSSSLFNSNLGLILYASKCKLTKNLLNLQFSCANNIFAYRLSYSVIFLIRLSFDRKLLNVCRKFDFFLHLFPSASIFGAPSGSACFQPDFKIKSLYLTANMSLIILDNIKAAHEI